MRKLEYRCTSDYGRYREQLFDLHRRGYGSVPTGLYDSLYLGNPYGDPLLALCFDGDRIVGQENYIRQDVACAGRVWKGGLGINTLVDPAYRLFHGVFGNLCKLSIEELEPEIDVLCAYANEDSKAYYMKYFDWKVASRVGVYKKAIGFSGLSVESGLSLLRRGRRGKRVQLREAAEFEPDMLRGIVEDYARQSGNLYFYKTPEFLNWRYLRNGHYDTTGYYILRNDRACGYCITWDQAGERKIIDMLVQGNDAGAFEAAIGWLACSAREQGMRRLVMYATPGCWYESTLKRLLFIFRWDFDFIVRTSNKDMESGNWLIHIGDFDIF